MESFGPQTPKDGLAGLAQNWRNDMVCGFIVFLIALPLCLGIAIASGVPPLAGIISAIVGGILVSQINGSYVTINGPAAGLIVVILASVERLGGGTVGYQATLGAIVIAGLALLILGLLKAGELGEFFPATIVHGLLAAIGIIIITKQIPFVLGVPAPSKEPLELIVAIPSMLANLNPEIAAIGFISLAILIAHSSASNKTIKKIPAAIIVIIVAILLGTYFDLQDRHVDVIGGHKFVVDSAYLIALPNNLLKGVMQPDFGQIASYGFWLSVISITLVQGLESLLACSAVEKLDTYRRHSNLSRDLAAVGLGSMISGMIGGLPMIAEIVRSTANIANGARTRWSNFFHGLFMLVFVVLATGLINRIPLSALAALLVVTGYRLASPRVFRQTYEIGKEQIFLFLTTIVATLATDLLIGVSIGILAKFILHLIHGAGITHLFSAQMTVDERSDGSYLIAVSDAAIFSNYLSIKWRLNKIPRKRRVVLDLTNATLVDHTVMERLHHYSDDYSKEGGEFAVSGLDEHKSASGHRFATHSR